MGDMTSEGANLGAGIDLSQFYQVFFEEAGENLDNMEQLLLNLDIENPDDEQMNAIFRCAHSIKGGAATFGFNDVAELTHQMETLLDKLRRHELAPTSPMVDVLLQSGDALKAQLARHQGSGADAVDTSALLSSIRTLVEGGTLDGARAPAAPAASAAPAAAPATAPAPAPLKSNVRQARAARRPAEQHGAGRQPGRAVQGNHRPRHDRAAGRRHSCRWHASLQGADEQHRQRPPGPVHLPCLARAGQAAATDRRLRLP